MGFGGSSPTVIQPPAPPPPPALAPLDPSVVGETSAQIAKTRLEFDPLLAAQQTQILQAEAPQLQALTFQLFPELQTLQQQVQQQLRDPASLTPEQAAAQQSIKAEATENAQRAARQAANLGGTLFGGARQEQEIQAVSDIERAFADRDISRISQQRAQTLQELATLAQIAFPQVRQPIGVTPSPDALIAAILGQQSNFPILGPTIVT